MRCGRVRLTLFFPLHISNFLYRIENVVCYPFRTANLVDNGTKEGQIGEGCEVGREVDSPVDGHQGHPSHSVHSELRLAKVNHMFGIPKHLVVDLGRDVR